jgi:hypothetical protein
MITCARAHMIATTPRDPNRLRPARTQDPFQDLVPSTTRSAHRAPEWPAHGALIGLMAQELPRHWPLSRSLGAAATRTPHGRGEAGSNRRRELAARPRVPGCYLGNQPFPWEQTPSPSILQLPPLFTISSLAAPNPVQSFSSHIHLFSRPLLV